MKYETPELTALTPAINAIQTLPSEKGTFFYTENAVYNENVPSYADWE